MSNLSNIGFSVQSEADVRNILELAYSRGKTIPVHNGAYVVYSDASGAELWLQFNDKKEFVGFNPHFRGQSQRNICLTAEVERPESPLDRAFYAWAAPSELNNPESGMYPFVFDLPNGLQYNAFPFPLDTPLQLAAFVQGLELYESEEDYNQHQTDEPKLAAQSFIPSGLFHVGSENGPGSPQATGVFAGIIKASEKRKNDLTGEAFYWLLVDTLGGEVDVVGDLRYFEKEPRVGGIAFGQFWLSGQLLAEGLSPAEEKKGFFSRWFGKK